MWSSPAPAASPRILSDPFSPHPSPYQRTSAAASALHVSKSFEFENFVYKNAVVLSSSQERRETGFSVRIVLGIGHEEADAPHTVGLLRAQLAALRLLRR